MLTHCMYIRVCKFKFQIRFIFDLKQYMVTSGKETDIEGEESFITKWLKCASFSLNLKEEALLKRL